MSLLFIHLRNSQFRSCDKGAEYDRPETALAMAVEGGLAVAADEINHGKYSVAVEVSVASEDGTQLLCSVVSISVSPLIPAVQPFKTADTLDNPD